MPSPISTIAFLLFLFINFRLILANPTVSTKYGTLMGTLFTTVTETSIDLFLGVPFAKQLSPESRGEHAEPPSSWEGIRIANETGPACLQNFYKPNSTELSYSEDCLYLNIYTPSNRGNNTFPVLFFIHGGAFETGSAVLGPNHPFAEHFASRDLVVVVIQYRLAAQGFVSSNSSSISGNIGLWDQTAALQYVSENIHSFGGDKDMVTVMGHSSGAMSASLLSLSPQSRDLFANLIALSGSSFAISAQHDNTLSDSQTFFANLGCIDQTQLLQCFQNASVNQIFEAEEGLHFFPVVGDEFLPISPPSDDIPPKPSMFGLMSLEALYFTFLDSDSATYSMANRDLVENFINGTLVPKYKDNQTEAAQKRLVSYFLNETEQSYPYYMRQYTKILSNLMFDIATLREVRARSTKAPTFLFNFDYFNPHEFDETFPLKETYHCHELVFLFGKYFDKNYTFNMYDYVVQDTLISAITNFVMTGNPSTEKVHWPTSDLKLTHLKLRPEPVVETGLFQSDFDFWEGMKHLGYDLITETAVDIQTSGENSSAATFLMMIATIFYIL